MDRKEYCKTQCNHYKPLRSGDCQYLTKARKTLKVFGTVVVRKGEYYCKYNLAP